MAQLRMRNSRHSPMPSRPTKPSAGRKARYRAAKAEARAMRRERNTPPTTTNVRGLAVRRGYLLAIDKRSARLFKLFNLRGRATVMPSKDGAHQYSWRLRDADAWLRKQPLLSDQ